MQSLDFQNIRTVLSIKREKILGSKGKDYRGASSDVLANFKKVAEELGITPMQALWVYMNKHFIAINKWIRCPDDTSSEPMEMRIVDAMNYLDLAYALMTEEIEESELVPACVPLDGERKNISIRELKDTSLLDKPYPRPN